MNFNGMNIVESIYAVTVEPKRKHKFRRWMSDSYHARIQKKWRKRFGTINVPAMYVVNPAAAGLVGQKHVVLHPELLAKLRISIEAKMKAKP